MDTESTEVTQLLKAWSGGDKGALDELTPKVYVELRRAANKYMRNESPATPGKPRPWSTKSFCVW